MKQEKKLWWQKPLRIAALQCESGKDAFKVLDKWEEMGFNTEQLLHVVGKGYRGFYIEEKHKDLLKEYINRAHKKGMRIILYVYPAYPGDLEKDHPDWRQLTVENKTQDTAVGMRVCLNSPWRDWFFSQIKKMAEFAIDGLFIDGPSIPLNACYCQHCRKKFASETEFDSLPEREDPADPAWRAFVGFKCKSVADFLAGAKDVLKSIRPEAIIYCNSSHGTRPSATDARDNREQLDSQDILGAEGGFVFYTNPNHIPLWKTAVTAKIIECQAEGKPTVIFMAGDFKSWNRYALPEGETQLMIADSVANDAGIWYGIHFPYQDLDTPGGRAASKMMNFLKDNEKYYEDTYSAAEVALVCSPATLNWYVSSAEETDFTKAVSQKIEGRFGNHSESLNGFYEMLLHCGFPFDVIDDEAILRQRIGKYKMLILPTCACMSDELAERIRAYVKEGGLLLASFDSSLFDENGSLRKDFALADVFGASYAGGFVRMINYSYMRVKCCLPFFEGYEQELAPSTYYAVKVRAKNATMQATFLEPSPGQYFPVSPEMSPGLLENSFGKGRCLYFAGDVGETYEGFGVPVHRLIVNNCILKWVSPQVRLLSPPEIVSLSVRRQPKKKRTLIHLVNYCGHMRRPIEKIVPLRNVQLQVRSVGKLRRIHSLVSPQELKVQSLDQRVTITIPELASYEVVAMEE